MATLLRSIHHIWHKYQGAKQGRFRPKTGNKNFGLLSQISLPLDCGYSLYFRLKFCMDEKTWLSSQHQYSITDLRMSLNQCSRTKKTGDCLLCRRRHCEKSAGWRRRRRQGKWGVCTCLFCLPDCPSPPHISLLLCALVHYFALYRARQVWSCSWICNVLEQVHWLTCESQQVQSNCLRGVCTTQGCIVTQFHCLRELLYLLPGREKRAPPPASLTNDSWLRHSVQLIYAII